MKKAIITTAIIFSASLSFYAKQSGMANSAQALKEARLNSDAEIKLNFNNSHKMDIGQADIK